MLCLGLKLSLLGFGFTLTLPPYELAPEEDDVRVENDELDIPLAVLAPPPPPPPAPVVEKTFQLFDAPRGRVEAVEEAMEAVLACPYPPAPPPWA